MSNYGMIFRPHLYLYCALLAPLQALADMPDLSAYYQAACTSAPLQKNGGWVCNTPKDYPSSPDRPPPQTCPLRFEAQQSLYAGRFTGTHQQTLMPYRAECEPHANNWGGLAVFDTSGAAPVIEGFFPGIVVKHCEIFHTAPEQDTAYCTSFHMGQGLQSMSFGPLVFAHGKPELKSWITLYDDRGQLAYNPVITCPTTETQRQPPTLRELLIPAETSLTRRGDILYLSAEITEVTEAGRQSACQRLQERRFSVDDIEMRMHLQLGDTAVETREGEYVIKPVWIKMTPPSEAYDILLTPP